MKKIVIVGTGFMGSAVAEALRNSGEVIELGIVEKNREARSTALDNLGCRDFSSNPGEIWRWADLVVLAFKPQDLQSAIESLLPDAGGMPQGTTIVSVLAGTSIATLSGLLGTDQVVRMMPNLAARIGKSVVGVSFSSGLDDSVRESVLRTFAPLGALLEIPERSMAAVTGVAGSGVAFVFEFIDALALGGVEQGLPYVQALDAALQVVESAAVLLRQTGTNPEEMVRRVCSPGGTTIAGIKALAREGLRTAVMEAVGAAASRSRELESE